MTKIMGTVALVIGLALLAPSWQAQESWRQTCVQQCYSRPTPGDPELHEAAERRRHGIPVDLATWRIFGELGGQYGCAPPAVRG